MALAIAYEITLLHSLSGEENDKTWCSNSTWSREFNQSGRAMLIISGKKAFSKNATEKNKALELF